MRRGLAFLAAALLAAACTGSHVGARQTATHALSAREQAQRDAQELLTHVRVPPSSAPTQTAPSSRLDTPFSQPGESTLVDRHRWWRVASTVDEAAAWLRSHPPTGFTLSENGNGGGPSYAVVQFAYEPTQRRTDGALRQLQIEVTNLDASSSGMRADGLAEWLDDRPMQDTAVGRRMHVGVDGACPPSSRGFVGVTNPGSELRKALVPAASPSAGRLCRYDGANGRRPFGLLADERLDGDQARRFATAARGLRLSHPGGAETSCPSDDGAVAVIALRFPRAPDVDLWVPLGGCAYVSNGQILAAGTLPGAR